MSLIPWSLVSVSLVSVSPGSGEYESLLNHVPVHLMLLLLLFNVCLAAFLFILANGCGKQDELLIPSYFDFLEVDIVSEQLANQPVGKYVPPPVHVQVEDNRWSPHREDTELTTLTKSLLPNLANLNCTSNEISIVVEGSDLRLNTATVEKNSARHLVAGLPH